MASSKIPAPAPVKSVAAPAPAAPATVAKSVAAPMVAPAAKPVATKPEVAVAPPAAVATKPVLAKPEAPKVPVANIETPKAVIVTPKAVEPAPVAPKVVAPKAVAPKIVAPKIVAPKAAAPKVAAEKAAAPKVAAPRAEAAKPAPAKATASLPVAELLKPVGLMQENMRAQTEKALTEMRGRYADVKGMAEKATVQLEDSVKAAQSGTREVGAKLLAIAKDQTQATLDHAKTLAAAKSLPDVMSAQQAFVLSQIKVAQTQSKDVASLMTRVANDMTAPLRATFEAFARR